jgi:hypothetical protein
MGRRGARPRFIAYKFVDPLTSPKIKQDESLAGLLDYLHLLDRVMPRVYGPAIYYIPVKDGKLIDPKLGATGIGIWAGGRKIRLFEFVEPPPAPGVEFIRQTEFIEEGSRDGEEEDSGEVRDDGAGPRPPWD